jgi:hypothetical protein
MSKEMKKESILEKAFLKNLQILDFLDFTLLIMESFLQEVQKTKPLIYKRIKLAYRNLRFSQQCC